MRDYIIMGERQAQYNDIGGWRVSKENDDIILPTVFLSNS